MILNKPTLNPNLKPKLSQSCTFQKSLQTFWIVWTYFTDLPKNSKKSTGNIFNYIISLPKLEEFIMQSITH